MFRMTGRHPKSHQLSVVIITQNEAERIGDCLKSVSWADEIVVVDDFSSDATAQIARDLGAKVYRHKLDLLGTQWQYAISKATHDWVFILAADEGVPKSLSQEIRRVLKNPMYDVYNIYRREYFLGQPLSFIIHGENIRLYRKGHAHFKSLPVHEGPFCDEPMSQLQTPIIHYSYDSIEQVMRKFNMYAHHEATLLSKHGVRYHPLKLALAPLNTFVWRQLSAKDYQNGIRGIVLSLLFCLSTFLKWLNIWEIEYRQRHKTKN